MQGIFVPAVEAPAPRTDPACLHRTRSHLACSQGRAPVSCAKMTSRCPLVAPGASGLAVCPRQTKASQSGCIWQNFGGGSIFARKPACNDGIKASGSGCDEDTVRCAPFLFPPPRARPLSSLSCPCLAPSHHWLWRPPSHQGSKPTGPKPGTGFGSEQSGDCEPDPALRGHRPRSAGDALDSFMSCISKVACPMSFRIFWVPVMSLWHRLHNQRYPPALKHSCPAGTLHSRYACPFVRNGPLSVTVSAMQIIVTSELSRHSIG
jgi:hypothetical protein